MSGPASLLSATNPSAAAPMGAAPVGMDAVPVVNAANPIMSDTYTAWCPSGQTPADAPWLMLDISSRTPGVFSTLASELNWGLIPDFADGADPKSEYSCPAAYAPNPGDSDLGDWAFGTWAYGEQLDPRSTGVYNAEPSGDYTVGSVGLISEAQERIADAAAEDQAVTAAMAAGIVAGKPAGDPYA